MKYAVVPQVYTIIAFGASIVLIPFMNQAAIDPPMKATPLYLIHPLLTLEFSLWLTTAIAWFIAFALSLRNIRKNALRLNEAVEQNFLVVSLATITIVVALSGCVGLLDTVHSLSVDSPNNLFLSLRVISFQGLHVCEPAWIIAVLWRYLSMRWTRS